MRWYSVGATFCAVLLAGCDKEATGQVAAVVNGDEITLQEINAELGGAEIPAGTAKEQAQQAALQNIVDRRLLAQAAREEGLDESPEFLIRQRQLENSLLVQLLSQKLDRTTKVPTEREIDAFMQENPGIFANRTVYTIDRIQFQMPADASALQALEDDHSMAEVASTLQQMNINFQRQPAQMDSARLGETRLKQILALPEGEPFLVKEGTVVTVGVITGREQAPIGGAEARPLAVQAMRNQSLSNTLRQRLEREKAEAEIEYKEGLAPARTAGETKGAPATKK